MFRIIGDEYDQEFLRFETAAVMVNAHEARRLRNIDMFYQQLVSLIAPSLVGIYAVHKGGYLGQLKGTGFWCDNHLFTAAHVVTKMFRAPGVPKPDQTVPRPSFLDGTYLYKANRIRKPRSQVFVRPYDGQTYAPSLEDLTTTGFMVQINPLHIDLIYDIAWIPCTLPSSMCTQLNLAERVEPGDTGVLFGLDFAGAMVVSQGKVGGLINTGFPQLGAAYFSGTANSQHSGGPLIRAWDSHVIGICLGGVAHVYGPITYVSLVHSIIKGVEGIKRRILNSDLSDQADLFPPPPPPPSPIRRPVSPEWDPSLVIIFPLYSSFSLISIFKGANCPNL